MNNHTTSLVKKALGVLLILAGILGLFLPFLQGIAMIVAGIFLVGNQKLIKKINALKKRWGF